MESSADREGNDAPGARRDKLFLRFLDALLGAGYDDLSGAVEIGDVEGRILGADLLYDSTVKLKDGGHGAGGLFCRFLHEERPGAHELKPFLEREDARGRKRRILAQAQTASGDDLEIGLLFLQRGESRQGNGVDGDLGYVGPLQVLFRTFEDGLKKTFAHKSGGFVKNIFRGRGILVEILAHADVLSALAREKQSDFCHDLSISWG